MKIIKAFVKTKNSNIDQNIILLRKLQIKKFIKKTKTISSKCKIAQAVYE